MGVQAAGQVAFTAGDVAHGLNRILQRAHDTAGNKGDQCGHDQCDSKPGRAGFQGLGAEFGLHVIDIDAGADHPAPWLEQLHIGRFLHWRFGPRLWPAIVEHARAFGFGEGGHLIENRKTVRVLDGRQIFAIQFGIGGMHDHERAQVIDPEVVVMVVAQLADGAQGLLLGSFTAQAAGGFEAVVVVQDTAGCLHHMPGFLGFTFIQIVMYLL